MRSWHCLSTLAIWAAVSWACSSNESASNGVSGGTAGIGGTATSVGGTGNLGGSGGTTGTNLGGSGAVQNGGPPCKIVYGSSLSGRTDVEPLIELTNTSINGGMLVNQYGVFWGQNTTIQTMPLTGGNPGTLVTGQYKLLRTLGSDLLISNRPSDTTTPTVYYRIAATNLGGTPGQILTLSSTESAIAFDEQFVYLYDTGATSIVRASLTDGARTTVESGVTSKPIEVSVYGDYLYYYTASNSEQIVKLLKAGGTSQAFYYDFDLWTFDITDDKLFVSTFNRVNLAPLSDPNSMVNIASIGSSSGLFIDSMTLSGSKVYIIDDDDGLSWVNLAGTQCEGLFVESMFFGAILIYDGYAYIEQDSGFDAGISRMKLPQ